jgi:hypothetical protein
MRFMHLLYAEYCSGVRVAHTKSITTRSALTRACAWCLGDAQYIGGVWEAINTHDLGLC